MMQIEPPNLQSPLLAANSGDRSALSMLTDTEMLRFGEFLDGCPATAFLYRDASDRSASSVDSHHLHTEPTDRFQRRPDSDEHHEIQENPANQENQEQLEQLRQQDIFHRELAAARKYSTSSSTDASEGIDNDADWTACSAPSGEVTIATSYDAGYAQLAGENAHEVVAHAAPPCFEVSCWPGDECAPVTDPHADCLVCLPFASDPVVNEDPHRIPIDDTLSQCEKGTSLCSTALNAPSPAHMEHYLPIPQHGEPEMVFTGMELSNADIQHLHLNHPLHYFPHQHHHQLVTSEQQHQHGQLFFPPTAVDIDGCHSAEHFPTSLQSLLLPLEGAGGARSTMELDEATYTRDHGAGGVWGGGAVATAAGFLAPTHFIKRDSRGNPFAAEPLAQNAKVRTRATDVAPYRRRPLESPYARRSSSVVASTTAASVSTALGVNTTGSSDGGSHSGGFSVDLELATVLNDCYWKNGRKNLQCFPVCPEHNDFYSMKMNNRKHSNVGVCRGPVYCHVISDAAAATTDPVAATTTTLTATASSDSERPLVPREPTRPPPQHMKYEYGVGASGSGGSARELFVLGRFERVPQRGGADLAGQLGAPPRFSSSAAFEQFRYSCFQAAELEDRRAPPDGAGRVRSTWCFLPDVWKVQPTLKKKRKATRSAPAQTFPFCFRVFVYAREDDGGGGGGGYACAAARASSFFELYSTRTVDRVKRKRWAKGEQQQAGVGAKRARRS